MPTLLIKIWHKEPPTPKSLDEDFMWLCRSLGLISARDKSATTAQVFKAIVIATKRFGGITIPQLTEALGLSRTAIIHHLGEIWDTGLIIKEGMRFRLRRYNLTSTIEEIRQDLNRILDRIETIAEDIDTGMGLPRR